MGMTITRDENEKITKLSYQTNPNDRNYVIGGSAAYGKLNIK